MKRYILVSLWSEHDEATRLSHAFAVKLEGRRSAAGFVHGEAPAHADVQTVAAAWPDAAVVIFAHGGPALAARSGTSPWIDAVGLAQLLSGRRVYAFACSTFTPHRNLALSTFADLAVQSCIQVFVGHEAPVMTPFVESGGETMIEKALCALIERFIDGEDDQSALANVGRMFASWDVPVALDLPSEDPNQEGAFGWSSAVFLGQFCNSLRVRTKADEAMEQGRG